MRIQPVMLLLAILALAACRQQSQPTGDVAVAFLEAYHAKAFHEAILYVVDDSKASLLSLEDDLRIMPLAWVDSFHIIATDTLGDDSLRVHFIEYAGSAADTLQLMLLRHGRTWKVQYTRNDPIEVARCFLNAFHKADWAMASQYVSPNSQRDLQVVANFYKGWRGPEVQIVVLQYNDAGDRALVTYREMGNDLIKKISLIREEGVWMVSFDKGARFEST
jgi:hypothetical protein